MRLARKGRRSLLCSESSTLEQLTDCVSFSGAERAELNTEAGRLCPAHDAAQPDLGFRAWKAAYDGNVGTEGQDLGRLDEHAADADVFGHPDERRAVVPLA